MTRFLKSNKIYIAGHRGMVGAACWKKFKQEGYTNLIGKSSNELDLRNQQHTLDFFQKEKPEVVIDAAARVGGILANKEYPYQFLMDNIQIQNNLIHASLQYGVKKFIFLGSSCIYPKLAQQPLKEEYLLTGPLEETNQWYAVAKISGVKLVEAIRQEFSKDYVALMPTNLYGPGDNYDLKTSHVLPAMIRKFHEAKQNGHAPVTLWGTGTPLREFLHVDDLAEAIFFSFEQQLDAHLYNVGSGEEISIKKLAVLVQEIVGHQGEILWDKTKPDGTPRKLLESNALNKRGWKARVNLTQGILETYKLLEI